MDEYERLFSEPKPEICFPVDLMAEIRAKGKSALPYWEAQGFTMTEFPEVDQDGNPKINKKTGKPVIGARLFRAPKQEACAICGDTHEPEGWECFGCGTV